MIATTTWVGLLNGSELNLFKAAGISLLTIPLTAAVSIGCLAIKLHFIDPATRIAAIKERERVIRADYDNYKQSWNNELWIDTIENNLLNLPGIEQVASIRLSCERCIIMSDIGFYLVDHPLRTIKPFPWSSVTKVEPFERIMESVDSNLGVSALTGATIGWILAGQAAAGAIIGGAVAHDSTHNTTVPIWGVDLYTNTSIPWIELIFNTREQSKLFYGYALRYSGRHSPLSS